MRTGNSETHPITAELNRRSWGTLKLPQEDAEKFLRAIHAYGYERSAAFLRRCAYAIIQHHEAGENPLHPLSFKTGHPHPFAPPGHPNPMKTPEVDQSTSALAPRPCPL